MEKGDCDKMKMSDGQGCTPHSLWAIHYSRLLSVVLSVLVLWSCGYQLVQEKGIYGGAITSLSVPVFKNTTYEPHASLYVTDAFTKELVSTGLFRVNAESSDGYVEGKITKITILPSTMNKDGLTIEKSINVSVELALFKGNSQLIRRWGFSDSEVYRCEDINAEDYNKRDALRRISGRIARRFSAAILVDY